MWYAQAHKRAGASAIGGRTVASGTGGSCESPCRARGTQRGQQHEESRVLSVYSKALRQEEEALEKARAKEAATVDTTASEILAFCLTDRQRCAKKRRCSGGDVKQGLMCTCVTDRSERRWRTRRPKRSGVRPYPAHAEPRNPVKSQHIPGGRECPNRSRGREHDDFYACSRSFWLNFEPVCFPVIPGRLPCVIEMIRFGVDWRQFLGVA